VQCADVTERLLVDERGSDPDLDRHVAECVRCAHVAQRLDRLDGVLGATLVVAPPGDLQRQLAQLVLEATRPRPASQPWWARVSQWNPADWLAQRPQMVAVQGLAAVLLALSSWQIFGWLSAFRPVVGDVAYAMELVAASPAAVYLGGLQIDLQSLGLWSLVGIAGWLVSEDGLIGRQLTSRRLRLP
jgi:anti-sigma factor RsiW